MPPRVERRHFWSSKCLILSFIVYWFASLGCDADADIQITSKSNVVLLSGYSIDLAKKQELTTLGASFNELLAALQGDLQDLFNANVEYLSERNLARLLDLQGIAQGSGEAIQRLFRNQKYTHLVVADVQMIGPEAGFVDLQVANLSTDGSVQEMQVIQTIKLTATMSPSQLDVARDQILRNFVTLRDVDAPRTVFISCILPRGQSGSDDIATQERLLGRDVTSALINFYHSEKMLERYRPVVHSDTYRWDDRDLSCSSTASTVRSAKAHQFDFELRGMVGISIIDLADEERSIWKVDLAIDVLRNHPDCQRTLKFPDKLHPKRSEEVSASYSYHLRDKFGQAWTDNVEKKSCS
jgi:hypothetical protein